MGSDGVLILGGDRVGSDGVLIGVGSISMGFWLCGPMMEGLNLASDNDGLLNLASNNGLLNLVDGLMGFCLNV